MKLIKIVAIAVFVMYCFTRESSAQTTITSSNAQSITDDYLGLWIEGHSGSVLPLALGSNLTPKLADHVLETVGPDWLLTPCRHHDGISQYPTKLGTPMENIDRDPIGVWRSATRERDIRHLVHFSGLWDYTVCESHPEWCTRSEEDGLKITNTPSIFSAYTDDYFLPLFKELIDSYDIDGAIIDGDFRFKIDYSSLASEAFKASTGLSMPRSQDDPDFPAFVEFHRKSYVELHNRYVKDIREYAPGFIICQPIFYRPFHVESAGAFNDFVYGLPSIHTTIFGSGGARVRSKVMSAQQEQPWFMHLRSLADWDFRSLRSPVQMKQEVAVGLAHGGGVGLLLQQREGSGVNESELNLISEVASFCRERQEVCHKASSIAQTAIIFSHSAFYDVVSNSPFSPTSANFKGLTGLLQSLIDAQEPVDVLLESKLNERIDRYSLVIWAGYDGTPPKVKKRLLEYVKKGGKLLLAGRKATQGFMDECDIARGDGESIDRNIITTVDGVEVLFKAASDPVRAGSRAKVTQSYQTHGREWIGRFTKSEPRALTTITPYGKGQIGAIHLDIGEAYLTTQQSGVRNLIMETIRELFPDPMLSVKGSRFVDVTLMEKNGHININLVNTAGDCRNPNIYVYDDIPPIGPISITFSSDRRPEKVVEEPLGEALPFEYVDSAVKITVPRVEIHTIISLIFED